MSGICTTDTHPTVAVIFQMHFLSDHYIEGAHHELKPKLMQSQHLFGEFSEEVVQQHHADEDAAQKHTPITSMH